LFFPLHAFVANPDFHFCRYCEDDANLYLRVKLGKNIIQDKGKVCKGNNQLEFYQSFELRVELPGVSQLEVSVVEKNFFGFDTVIGTTTLDLEDRFFNEKWRNGNFDNIGNIGKVNCRISEYPLRTSCDRLWLYACGMILWHLIFL